MPRTVNGIIIWEENRFSEFVLPRDRDGAAILEKWVSWFTQHDINSALVLTGRGYAVYRDGLVPTDQPD